MNEDAAAAAFDPRRDADAIVIGASAGGVEVLSPILASLPAGFEPAVLVVLHLPPGRPSGVASLMARHCVLPVLEAVDKQPVARGTVVFAPPDYHLLVEPGGTLALSVDPPVLFSRPAIDPLFESAAAAYGRRLLGLLLTGASTDGSAGAAAIRRAGGTVWVQCPEEASAKLMPTSALAHAGAVITIDELCRRLSATGRHRTPQP